MARPSSTPNNWRHDSGLTYIHGFDDPAIIAGQGTVGLEILEQVPDVEAIVVPIGGGGLVAGVALAVKSLKAQAYRFSGSSPSGLPGSPRRWRRGTR